MTSHGASGGVGIWAAAGMPLGALAGDGPPGSRRAPLWIPGRLVGGLASTDVRAMRGALLSFVSWGVRFAGSKRTYEYL